MQKLIYRNRKGFSLIELIVVMAVMAILVLLAAPRFLGYTKDAAVSAMQADAKVLSNAALQYNIKTEEWPLVLHDHDSDPLTADVPQAVAVTSVDSEVVTFIQDELGITLADASNVPADEIALFTIDTEASKDNVTFSSLIKNTKNPVPDYYIIVDGEFAGEVFYNDILEDSSSVGHNGVY